MPGAIILGRRSELFDLKTVCVKKPADSLNLKMNGPGPSIMKPFNARRPYRRVIDPIDPRGLHTVGEISTRTSILKVRNR